VASGFDGVCHSGVVFALGCKVSEKTVADESYITAFLKKSIFRRTNAAGMELRIVPSRLCL
jgi:hypothetical protein